MVSGHDPPMSSEALGGLLVIGAAVLDRLIGDPRRWLHPVVVMGWIIQQLRHWVERWAGDHPIKLRIGGGLISMILVLGSVLTGWCLERLLCCLLYTSPSPRDS